jgi:hypothetical protein
MLHVSIKGDTKNFRVNEKISNTFATLAALDCSSAFSQERKSFMVENESEILFLK